MKGDIFIMKLNPDCLRDLLLLVEDETDLANSVIISPSDFPQTLSSYESDEVMYHIKQAQLSNLIEVKWFVDGSCLIKYLTPNGHQFVSNIENDGIWSKVKDTSKKIGINSVSTLVQIASNVVLAAIQSHF